MKAITFLALSVTGATALGLGAACSSSTDTVPNAGGSAGQTTTTTTITTTTNVGGGGGAGGAGDNDNDCAHASVYADVANAQGWAEGAIGTQGDADFYLLTLEEGTFWILEANVPGLDEEDPGYVYDDWLDPVISVFNEDGSQLLASMDDSYPRYDTDTELVYRAPASGTYCIKVEDWGSWAGEARPVGLNFGYEFGLLTPSDPATGNVFDTEANNDAAGSQAQTWADASEGNSKLAWLFGGLDAAADVDVYTVTVPATGISGFQVFEFLKPGGPGAPGSGGEDGTDGNGSTVALGLINVTNADGTDVIAQFDASRPGLEIFGRGLNMPLTPGETYHLWIQRSASSSAGANDFYDLIEVLLEDASMNWLETETAAGANDTSLTAETPPVTESTHYYVRGFMNAPTDADFFKFNATAGNYIALACSAVRDGSGLDGATFAILDMDGTTVLQTETESEDVDLRWSTPDNEYSTMAGVAVTTTGDYYLRVTTNGQKAGVSGTFYMCGIHDVEPS